jgi:two-component system, NarL family, sensor histidine kinase BarA
MSDPNTADLHHGEIADLEDLIDRDSLREVCRSFFDLFGLSIRVFSLRGALLANVHEERSVCRYANSFPEGRRACIATVGQAQALIPKTQTVIHPCFTGALYHIVPILYDGRSLGRIVLGPFVSAELDEPPATLLQIDPGVQRDRARLAILEMPRVRADTAARIAAHLRGVLDLILFSGHRAHLTSAMHLVSVRENYRELAEKNARLQEAYDRLQELDRLKSNFLATVSHELRTPLTSIIGYSEMLQAGVAGDLQGEQVQFVETIRSKGELLLGLITSLLDLNKLERGQLTITPQSVDPHALLRDVQQSYAAEAEKKRIVLHTECQAGIPQLRADPVHLRQVLINLVGNAIKFTPAGGRVKLEARASELALLGSDLDDEDGFGAALMLAPEPAIEFRVEDSGIGMAPDQREKIFEAFYQVDGSSTREYGGAGLGLAIAKSLVEAHHGVLRVESSPGQGSVFLVILPTVPPEHEFES